MPIELHEVKTPSDDEAFFSFPFRLYRQDPSWVPPIREYLRRRLAPSNPFFREATLKRFIARRGAEVVGTVSALRDKRWENLKDEKVSFFGFFETENDPEVAEALLGVASEEARGWGMETLRGPRDLTRVEAVGITVEGHKTSPPLLASHHAPYVQGLVEGLGFVKHHDVLAYDVALFDAEGNPRPLPEKLQKKSDAVDLPGLTVDRAHWLSVRRDLADAHAVFTEAFKTVPDTTPMPQAQFVNLGRFVLAFSDMRMIQIARVNGKPVAFAGCVPELNEAVRHAGGRIWPMGWANFARGLRHIETASFKLIGVLPEYRKSGVHARLIAHVVEALRGTGYRRLEASLIDERNAPMRSVVEGAGMEIYRRYRIYEKKL